MAAALSRNANCARHLSRLIYYRSLCQWASSTVSSPVSNELRHRTLPQVQSGIYPRNGFQSFAIYQRFVSSTATTTTDKFTTKSDGGENSGDKTDTKSDGGETSGESQQSGGAGKPIRGGPVSWLSFLLLLATGAGILYYFDKEKKRYIEGINNASKAVKEGPSAGKAAIGGPFNLINHDGKNVTEKNFLGKWTVVYFGFTHCPDICPDELIKLADAVDKIKKKSGLDIVPVFISVDPERDTVEQVREYVKEFHPTLIGLTGTMDEIKKVARSYRVYFMKTEEEDSDYLVDHSIVMYLMSPEMKFVKFFGKNENVDSLTDGVIKEIKQYKK
ncbi:protein SCO1 1 mitochondrial [Tripterygium wilfordii]|uniref:Protein SCO1 1 mitochondrial n=1 Tax=Tripterygium wilfordii TaxID=458696 RepID=A0A7J7DMM9_TRIWF|nr:protein SCO1 homolog 1, mitochondrial [Tripterygium wilfordii]KAF5747630.1 protein SCO1 1 mitochondrial [Tripterygium wilfordii]